MTTWLVVAVVLLWCVVIALSLTVFALTRQIGVLYERVAPAGALMVNQALKVGDTAPEIKTETLTGSVMTIGANGNGMLLFFVAPDCPICKSLLPVFKSLSQAETDFDFILASDGDTVEEHETYVASNKLDGFPYVLSEILGRSYGVSKLPYAILIRADGTIGSMGIVNSREHLESLFEAEALGIASLQDYLNPPDPVVIYEPEEQRN
jgi:methylamine dehydrogenase accessory protein MauD